MNNSRIRATSKESSLTMTVHILLIENRSLAESESLVSDLEGQEFQVTLAHTPETAANKTNSFWPDVIVFNSASDIRLSSFQKAINKVNLNIPHIVIGDEDSSSKAASSDTVYTTPGNPQQLIRTVKEATAKQKERFIRFSNLVVDCQQRQVLHNKKCYHLTPKTYSLLQLLIDNQDRDLSRKVIMKHVWETDYMGDTRTLDVHIRWLREKIEDDPSRPQRLITIRGVGYRFVADPE